MIVYAAADLHGNLPEVPGDADVVLLAGDICPDFEPRGREGNFRQANWLDTEFRGWLDPLFARGCKVVATWGNHDYVGMHKSLIPDLNWTLLIDREVTVHAAGRSLRVWGTPWVPNLPRWAFYASAQALAARAELIPAGLDVLMTHGPPYKAGDFVPYNASYAAKYGTPVQGEYVGDHALNVALARAQPLAVVCGHIHEARGVHFTAEAPKVPVYNVAVVDEQYRLYKNPFTRLHL